MVSPIGSGTASKCKGVPAQDVLWRESRLVGIFSDVGLHVFTPSQTLSIVEDPVFNGEGGRAGCESYLIDIFGFIAYSIRHLVIQCAVLKILNIPT